MDRLSFQIGEQVDYLQHSISPYIQTGSRAARNVLNSAYAQVVGARHSDIPFTTWIQWQWTWFLENCNSLCYSLKELLSNLGKVIHSSFSLFGEKLNCKILQQFFFSYVDRTHICFFIIGVGVGLITGVLLRQNLKPLTRMRALGCNSYKGAESICMVEDQIAPSSCGAEEVLIQVKASSVDSMDLKITLGYGKVIRKQYHKYNKAHSKDLLFPFVLGRECSGRILEIGSKVQDLDIGDEVYAAVPYYACGICCEVALVPADWVAKKPRKLSYEAAASLPYSASIVWNALVEQAGFDAQNTNGKRVLVHSADNPIGCIAVQIVKAWGGHVTATVGTRGLPTVQLLGADDIVLHDGPNNVDFQALLAERPKFDLVLNTLGSFLIDDCNDVCKDGGLVVSTVASPPASDQFGLILGSLYSVWLRIKLVFLKGSVYGSSAISRPILDEISNLVNKGQLQPVIERVFDIDQAEQAGQYSAKGDTIGKIIVRFR